MGLFGNSRLRRASESVLALLRTAIRRLNPERAIDELDLALDAQPELSTLNALLGREGHDRFGRVILKDVVDRALIFQSKGLTDLLAATIQAGGIEAPSNAIMAAGIHLAAASGHSDKDFMVSEITETSETLIAMLNQQGRARDRVRQQSSAAPANANYLRGDNEGLLADEKNKAAAATIFRNPYPGDPILPSSDPFEEAHKEKLLRAILSYRGYRQRHRDPENPSPEDRAKARSGYSSPSNVTSVAEIPMSDREREQLEATRIVLCAVLGLSDETFYDHEVPELLEPIPAGMHISLNAHGFERVAKNIGYDRQLAVHDILAVLLHHCSSLPDLTIEAAAEVATEIYRQRSLDRPGMEYVEGKPRYVPPARKRSP